ncbi:MAG: aldolase/citrate lyase family protein [bacterium]
MNPRDERFFDPEQIELRNKLSSLIEKHRICTMKLSTEDAGMPFEDIRERHRLFGDLLALQLKIGGPEARNDMRTGVTIGCRALIAPMVESPYSLKNFLNSCREVLGEKKFSFIDKQVNIETRQGVANIENILTAEGAEKLAQVTIGRHDLCRSFGEKPNHPRVLKATKKIVDVAREQDISTSVGGRITPDDARMIAEDINPDKINTREVGFYTSGGQEAKETVKDILEFERALLEHERNFYRREDTRLTERIKKLKGRHGR